MPNNMIIFVHGLGGDPAGTWGRFPELIKADPTLKEFDTTCFAYPTSLFRLPFSKKYLSIQTLADALRTLLNVTCADRANLILVCHSLGGLIARRYLIDEVKRQTELRVRGLLLYAVPNDGAGLAEVSSYISWRHDQLRQLCRDSDLIRDLSSDWETFGMANRVSIHYVVGGLDRVVNEKGARGGSWGSQNVDVIPDRGHRSIVKPLDANDLSYRILEQFAVSVISDPAAIIERYATRSTANRLRKPASKKGYRVIGFDLDGTLLRGIEFSWTVVWKHLGIPAAVYKGAMKDYLKGSTTYQEWCDKAVAQFRAKGLRRSDFSQIVSCVTVTRNLNETLATLRTSGFVLALISGGMDTFIEEKIPNAAELFDYICINRIRYDQPSGLIAGVDATPFDFQGKTVALKAICERNGCTLKEAVFVGEGFNDEDIAKSAGLSIAYPPGETSIDATSERVEEDDLNGILKYVL